MMAAFLLARAGVDVIVLEKHADFLRDFRGDTIHPSTLELMYELGLLEEFLCRPHQEMSQIRAIIYLTDRSFRRTFRTWKAHRHYSKPSITTRITKIAVSS